MSLLTSKSIRDVPHSKNTSPSLIRVYTHCYNPRMPKSHSTSRNPLPVRITVRPTGSEAKVFCLRGQSDGESGLRGVLDGSKPHEAVLSDKHTAAILFCRLVLRLRVRRLIATVPRRGLRVAPLTSLRRESIQIRRFRPVREPVCLPTLLASTGISHGRGRRLVSPLRVPYLLARLRLAVTPVRVQSLDARRVVRRVFSVEVPVFVG